MSTVRGRFAPSTTGRAHPGTLLAALLCWLDARAAGSEVWLRLEDLDPDRSRPDLAEAMVRDLEWFGLDWDGTERQSRKTAGYAATLDRLAAAGQLYACQCSRSAIKKAGQRAPDGSYRYPGTCREQRLSENEWRDASGPIRMRIPAGSISLRDESGADLGGDPEALFGDPLVRRRDGAYAYHFASVVDDESIGVNRIVRGRDLAPSSVLQAAVRVATGGVVPTYRHHFLLLEGPSAGASSDTSPDKFSKFHGAVDVASLRSQQDAAGLCGQLASFAGLAAPGTRCRPADLVDAFDWSRVRRADLALTWSSGEGLRPAALSASPD